MKDEISLEEIKAIIDLIRQSESITHFTLKYGDVEILTRARRGSQHSGECGHFSFGAAISHERRCCGGTRSRNRRR